MRSRMALKTSTRIAQEQCNGYDFFVLQVPCAALMYFIGAAHAHMLKAVVALMCIYVAGFAWSW